MFATRHFAMLIWAFLAIFVILGASAAWAQGENFSAGKSPAQLFNSDCTACHATPRGLGVGKSEGSLAGFLREHYTTSRESAGALANFLATGEGRQGAPARAKLDTDREPPAGAQLKRQPAAERREPSSEDERSRKPKKRAESKRAESKHEQPSAAKPGGPVDDFSVQGEPEPKSLRKRTASPPKPAPQDLFD